MKKFVIAFASVVTFISASAFSGKDPGTNPALATFESIFRGALDVKWSENSEVISASFVLGETRTVAYFNRSGELLGTARNILFNQLPLSVITEINKRFGSSSVYNIIEYTAGDATFYSMTAVLPTKEVNLKATSSGEITVEGKVKK